MATMFGSESSPNLYCKLDIEVYPIVRATNNDPGKSQWLKPGLVENGRPPEILEYAELFRESSCRIGVGNSHKTFGVGRKMGSLSFLE